MIKLSKNLSMLLILFMAISVFILSCDDDEATRGGRTTIRGVVEGIIVVEASREENISIFAKVKSFFSFFKNAIGQESGVVVTATQDGETSTDTTNDDGEYVVTVPGGGPVNMTFGDASTNINVTPNSDVTLDVRIDFRTIPPSVAISKFDISSPKIRTSEGESFPFDEPEANLTIDGNGDNCVSASGDSTVDIIVQDLTVDDCNNGVITEDFAEVRLEAVAVPTVSINADNDGIRASGDSAVVVAGGNIHITAGKNGIHAFDNAEVDVNSSSDDCTIQGDEGAVDQEGSSMVNTPNCDRIGPPPVIPTPTASPIVIPTPTATPIVIPTPTATPIVIPTPTATPIVIPTPTPTAAPRIIDVSMEDNFFDPKEIIIKVGDTVRWTNNGVLNHTTTSDVGPGAIWNSDNQFPLPGGMAPGDVFQFTFTSEDVFPYFCLFHGAPGGIGMAGTVTVE